MAGRKLYDENQLYDEKQLLLKIAAGDQQAFARLAFHYKNNIYTSALRLLHSSVIAEEVVQDVFLAVWMKRSSLPAVLNFPAYLNGITKNIIYTAFKQSLREKLPARAEEAPDAWGNNAETWLEDKEYSAILQQAIDRLPPKQKKTYLLIRHQGMKREEAARELCVSPETVKFNLEEATRKVRDFCILRLQLISLLFLFFLL